MSLSSGIVDLTNRISTEFKTVKQSIATKATSSAVPGVVVWNGTAWPTRPAGYGLVIWVGGTTQPTGMAVNDLWEHNA